MDRTPVCFSLEWRDAYDYNSVNEDESDDGSSQSFDTSSTPSILISQAEVAVPGLNSLTMSDDSSSSLDVLPQSLTFTPRGYQLELCRRAINENIIICVETGAGKTLVSGMLIQHVLERVSSSTEPITKTTETQLDKSLSPTLENAPLSTIDAQPPLSKPCPNSSEPLFKPSTVVFLVHRVSLVMQQAEVLEKLLPSRFRVGCYHGNKGVDNWSPERWSANVASHSVLVMTAQILLNLLRHGLISMQELALLVVDEAHHATKNHPYRRVFMEFYHSLAEFEYRPRVFGMTATPVKAKNASVRHANCLDAITELEATMDSTVVTVSERSRAEVERLVPKMDEFVVSYIPSISPVDDLGDFTYIEEKADIEALYDILSHSAVETVDTDDTCAKSEDCSSMLSEPEQRPAGYLSEPEMQILDRLNNRLGFIAAKDIAERLCAHHNISPDNTVKVLLQQCSNLDTATAGVRDKVFKLFDILYLEYKRCAEAKDDELKDSPREQFRSIVFTHERICAVALSNLVNAIFAHCECAELTARPVLGASQTSSFLRMSQPVLHKTLEDFRQGEFGILIATNVIEEGIDIPACRLVVSFDPPLSPSAYVQGRGRARKHGARYISFVASGVDSDYYSLWRAREGARVMSDVSRGAYATEDQRRMVRSNFLLKQKMKVEKTLFSRTTPARITANEALNLLVRYTTVKGELLGVEALEAPRYEVFPDQEMFTASVFLDSRIPIDGGFCTDLQMAAQLAKRLAALDAYRKLYEIGEVDEYLLPKRHTRSRRVLESNCEPPGSGPIQCVKGGSVSKKKSHKKSRPKVEPKSAKKHKRMRVCKIAHPLEPKTSTCESSIATTQDSAESSDNEKLELLSRSINDVDRSRACENTSCARKSMFLYKLELAEEFRPQFMSTNFNQNYGLVLRQSMKVEDLTAVQCPSGNTLLTLIPCEEVEWSADNEEIACKFVRAVQVCLRGKAPGSLVAAEIHDVYEQGDYTKPTFYLLPLKLCASRGFNIDWSVVQKLLNYEWRSEPFLSDAARSSKDLSNLLVCSSHDEDMGRIYFSGTLSDELTTESSCEGYIAQDYSTFREYYETKHGVTVKDVNQFLLPGYSLRGTLSCKSNSAFWLVPELVHVVPVDPFVCHIAFILPQWQKFVALRECWHQNAVAPIEFLDFARALQPNVNDVGRENSDLCYERSEFLGDSVLKVINSLVKYVVNPNGNEGDLSDARDIEVSNGHLADVAVRMKLHDCVAYSGVSHKAKSWPWFWGICEKKPLSVSEKVLADCVEALTGAHYQCGGFILACLFLERHGLLQGACRTLGISVEEDGTPHDVGGIKMDVPHMSINDNRHKSSVISEIEKKIGYEFKEKKHLVIALTHGSYEDGKCVSYQKYEYLGDAIVGFLLLSHFHDKYPHLGPHELTNLRGPALSNDLFARVIVTHGIHQLFWYKSEKMKIDIKTAAEAILNEESDDEDICKKMAIPKVLGDLFESIVGAIVVDQGMRMEIARGIVLQLLQPELDRFANPNRFKLNAVTTLLIIVQKTFQTNPEYLFLDKPEDVEKKCEVWVNSTYLGSGTGSTRRLARIMASTAAVERLDVHSENAVLGQKDFQKDQENACEINGEHNQLTTVLTQPRKLIVYDDNL